MPPFLTGRLARHLPPSLSRSRLLVSLLGDVVRIGRKSGRCISLRAGHFQPKRVPVPVQFRYGVENAGLAGAAAVELHPEPAEHNAIGSPALGCWAAGRPASAALPRRRACRSQGNSDRPSRRDRPPSHAALARPIPSGLVWSEALARRPCLPAWALWSEPSLAGAGMPSPFWLRPKAALGASPQSFSFVRTSSLAGGAGLADDAQPAVRQPNATTL